MLIFISYMNKLYHQQDHDIKPQAIANRVEYLKTIDSKDNFAAVDMKNNVLSDDNNIPPLEDQTEEHFEGQIPFGSSEFFLYILYAFSKMISCLLLCRINVGVNSRIYIDQSS